MAAYDTDTKIFINDATPHADSVAGHLAKEVNDYIQTLDSTNNAIISLDVCPLKGDRVMVIIVHPSL